jgi:hypothetical protein
MPKQKKKGEQEKDENLDDMLAELQKADLATASSAASLSAASSSSSTAGTDPSPSSSTPTNIQGQNVSADMFVCACIAGNLAQLQRWGRQGVRVRTAEPLFKAVIHGASFDVLSCLVKELGTDVNQHDDHGWTALTIAASLGKHEIVNYLVEEFGGDVKIQGKVGKTPLYFAAGTGHLAALQVLLKLGADI